jgi:hypothetical protein
MGMTAEDSCCVNKKLNRDRAMLKEKRGGGGGSSLTAEGKERDLKIDGKRDERSAH